MRTSLEPLRANTTRNLCHFFQVLCCRNAAHSCSDSFGEWVVLGSGWCWTTTWADGSFWGCLCSETTTESFFFSGLLILFISDKHVWKFGSFLDMSCPMVQHEVRLMFPVVVMGFVLASWGKWYLFCDYWSGVAPHPMICMTSIFPASISFRTLCQVQVWDKKRPSYYAITQEKSTTDAILTNVL